MVINEDVNVGDKVVITYDDVYHTGDRLNLVGVTGIITQIERKGDIESEDSFMFKHSNYRGELKSVRIRGCDEFRVVREQAIDW